MYEEHMHRNITKDYKKANNDDFKKVTKEDEAIANKLEIDDRVYSTSKREAFLTLKDHKPNYINNPTFRLLNPTKQELGKVRKNCISCKGKVRIALVEKHNICNYLVQKLA